MFTRDKNSMSESPIPKDEIQKCLRAIIGDIGAAEPSAKKDLASAAKSLADILTGEKAATTGNLIEHLMQQLEGSTSTAPDGDSPDAIPEHLQESKE